METLIKSCAPDNLNELAIKSDPKSHFTAKIMSVGEAIVFKHPPSEIL